MKEEQKLSTRQNSIEYKYNTEINKNQLVDYLNRLVGKQQNTQIGYIKQLKIMNMLCLYGKAMI